MASRGEIEAGRAYVRLSTKDSAFTAGLKRAEAKLKAFGDKVGAIGERMTLVGGAILGALTAAAKGFASMGDELDKMSSRVGASVEFLSALSHAAQIGGTDIKAMETGIRRMQRTAMDATRGLSTAVDTFDELGMSVYGLDGNLKQTEALFMESAAALAKLDNNTKKAALASMLFGRAGTQLLPMLKDGKAGLMAVMQEARELGLVMSTEDATAAAELTDQMTRLYSAMKRVLFDVGAALAGEMGDLADRLTLAGKATAEWVRRNQEMIVGVAKLAAGVTALGIALKGLAVLCAHPVVAGLIAVGIAMQATAGHAAQLSNEMERARAAGDRQREADLQRLDALEKLAQKQRLSSDEMAQANTLIGQLEKNYGDLGLSVNEATGALEGFAAAQARATAEMKAAAAQQLRAQISESMRNQQALQGQLTDLHGGPGAAGLGRKLYYRTGAAALLGDTGESRRKGLVDQIRTEQERRAALMARMQALQGPGREALTGRPGGGIGAATGGPGRFSGIPAADPAALKRWTEQEVQRAKQQDAAAARIEEQIARARIDATVKGEEREKALLELEKQQMLKEYGGMGLGAKIQELFGLRQAATGAEVPGITGRSRGTFYGEAASRLGKTGDPNEQTAENTKKCADGIKKLVDRGQWNRGIPVV